MKKKKVILTSIIVMVIIMLSIGIKVSLYEPSKINAVIASKVFKTPANTAFKDDNFYKCVVDAYNWQNSPDVGYDANLTDEQYEKEKAKSNNYLFIVFAFAGDSTITR